VACEKVKNRGLGFDWSRGGMNLPGLMWFVRGRLVADDENAGGGFDDVGDAVQIKSPAELLPVTVQTLAFPRTQ
jgi:hypothetical protein